MIFLAAGPPGFIFLDWDDAPRADSYNVLQKLSSSGSAAFTVIANVLDSDATVAAPPAGVSAEYFVEGINAAGHSPPSDTVTTGP